MIRDFDSSDAVSSSQARYAALEVTVLQDGGSEIPPDDMSFPPRRPLAARVGHENGQLGRSGSPARALGSRFSCHQIKISRKNKNQLQRSSNERRCVRSPWSGLGSLEGAIACTWIHDDEYFPAG